jgi:hypothetical protein
MTAVIKVSWVMAGLHMDQWAGEDTGEAAAVVEARIGAEVESSGMTPDAIRSYRETFLAPVVEGLRTEAGAALARGGSWSKAAGPVLVVATPVA